MPTIVHFEILQMTLKGQRISIVACLDGWKIEKWSGSTNIGIEYWTINTTDEKGNKAWRWDDEKTRSPTAYY